MDTRFESLSDAVEAEPGVGTYLVSNTLNRGKVFMLDAHFDRFERSADALGVPVTVPREKLREVLRSMVRESGFEEVRFRISMGIDLPDTYLLSVEQFRGLPEELLSRGIVCRTGRSVERENPVVKSTRWLHVRQELTGDAIFEFLLCDEGGNILEGTSSNFFAVLGDSLRTADSGILSGITRRAILQIARDILPVDLRPVTVEELGNVREACITSSTRGVVPIRWIDDVEIGNPGPIMMELGNRFHRWQSEHLESL